MGNKNDSKRKRKGQGRAVTIFMLIFSETTYFYIKFDVEFENPC